MGNEPSGNNNPLRGLTINNATVKEAMDRLESDSPDTSFFEYTVAEINRIGEYLTKNSTWEELDYDNSTVEEVYKPLDYSSALFDYFRENSWNTRYGNGEVPANLLMKVLIENATGKQYSIGPKGQSAWDYMYENEVVSPPEFIEDFVQNYESSFNAYVSNEGY